MNIPTRKDLRHGKRRLFHLNHRLFMGLIGEGIAGGQGRSGSKSEGREREETSLLLTGWNRRAVIGQRRRASCLGKPLPPNIPASRSGKVSSPIPVHLSCLSVVSCGVYLYPAQIPSTVHLLSTLYLPHLPTIAIRLYIPPPPSWRGIHTSTPIPCYVPRFASLQAPACEHSLNLPRLPSTCSIIPKLPFMPLTT